MIILQQTLKDQLQNESGKKTSSPSSFFKSKWLEEQDQKKTFNHLNSAEIDQTIQERIYFKSSKASDYERFQEMNDMKRSSDFKVFSKLRSIIKPYQKLEFQKLTEELEALDLQVSRVCSVIIMVCINLFLHSGQVFYFSILFDVFINTCVLDLLRGLLGLSTIYTHRFVRGRRF